MQICKVFICAFVCISLWLGRWIPSLPIVWGDEKGAVSDWEAKGLFKFSWPHFLPWSAGCRSSQCLYLESKIYHHWNALNAMTSTPRSSWDGLQYFTKIFQLAALACKIIVSKHWTMSPWPHGYCHNQVKTNNRTMEITILALTIAIILPIHMSLE